MQLSLWFIYFTYNSVHLLISNSKFIPLPPKDLCCCCCCCSVAHSCLILCEPMDCSTPGLPVLHSVLEFAGTHVHWVGHAVQPCHPLLLLPSLFSSIRVFSNELAPHIRWPKYCSFSISPSNEYSGWFPLGLTGLISSLSNRLSKSLPWHHSLKTSILQHSSFFMAQLSHPYMTTGKTQLWLY